MTNYLIAFYKLKYSVEYIAVAAVLLVLLMFRSYLASKVRATQAVRSAKRKTEKKDE